jgi:tripartite-type tricarboxylate transporter receptor subunit TctC
VFWLHDRQSLESPIMARLLHHGRYLARLTAMVLALALAGAVPGRAEFPDRPIRVIVPFPAGGIVDLVARLATQRIGEEQGWSFVIENKAAAGGIVGTDAAAKAAPDGYTLLIVAPNHTINAALKSKLPYNWERDLVPVSMIAEVPELLVCDPAAPFTDFAGFVAYAKQNPNKLSYSSAGIGTVTHVSMELLLSRAGARMLHVPYRGAAPALTDVLAGVVQVKFDSYATASEHIATGRLRALAIASARRSVLMPDLPTIAELGFPDYEGVQWIGLMAPAGVPASVIDRLAQASMAAVRNDALVARLRRDGIEPVGSTAAAFGARISKEVRQWRELGKTANITIE